MNIYIDTDIILDFLLKRATHHKAAEQLFEKIKKKEINAFTTPVAFANLYYLLNSTYKVKNPKKIMTQLRQLLSIMTIQEKVIDQALTSDITDFEDAIQYHTCLNTEIQQIITRNKKDYKKSKIPVNTAEELINLKLI